MFGLNNRNILGIVTHDIGEVAEVGNARSERARKVNLTTHNVVFAVGKFDKVVFALIHKGVIVSKESSLAHSPNCVTLVAACKHTVYGGNVCLGYDCGFYHINARSICAAVALAALGYTARLITARTDENKVFNLTSDSLGDNFHDIGLESRNSHIYGCAARLNELNDFVTREAYRAEVVGCNGNSGIFLVDSCVIVCALNRKLEITRNVENLTTLQNRRNLVHFLDNFVSGALGDSRQRRISSGAISSLLVLGKSLALQGLEPSGAVLLVLVESVRRACGYGVGNFGSRDSTHIDTLDSSLALFESLVLGVEVAQFFFDFVEVYLAVALEHSAELCFTGVNFVHTLNKVHSVYSFSVL